MSDDLVKRLRDCDINSAQRICGSDIFCQAADRIEADAKRIAEFEATLAQWQAQQNYTNIGRNGKPVLARDLERKVEIAIDTLEAIIIHENSTFLGPDGEKSKRASWRGVKRKVQKAYTLLGK